MAMWARFIQFDTDDEAEHWVYNLSKHEQDVLMCSWPSLEDKRAHAVRYAKAQDAIMLGAIETRGEGGVVTGATLDGNMSMGADTGNVSGAGGSDWQDKRKYLGNKLIGAIKSHNRELAVRIELDKPSKNHRTEWAAWHKDFTTKVHEWLDTAHEFDGIKKVKEVLDSYNQAVIACDDEVQPLLWHGVS